MIFKFVNPIAVCQKFTIRFYSLVNKTSRGQHVGLAIGRAGFDTRQIYFLGTKATFV